MTSFLAPKDVVWELRTDSNGVAALSDEASLEFIFPLSKHGHQTRHWMWCVERIGHLPVAGSQASERQMEHVYVLLAKGYAAIRCNASDRFADVGSWQERLENARKSGNMPRPGSKQ